MSDAQSVPPVTQALAAYSSGRIALPADVQDLALRSLVDTVAVVIAAAGDEAVRILREGTDALPGRSTVLFDAGKTAAETAALLNGTAAHALDFDDVTLATHGHPGAVLWPAALAVGEEVGASGRAMLEAYIAGFVVSAALGRGIDLADHYARGWHTTSTLGAFGAAASAARLLGLGPERTRHALGLVGSMASGSRQNFGSMTKPLHAGLAARDGIFAARLAADGFTADPAQLESPLGFFAMYDRKPQPARALEILADAAAPMAYGLNLKQFPCCYGAARAAATALALHHEERIDPAHVRRVRVTLNPHGAESLNHHRPTTGLEGKFSAEYVVATALLDGFVKLASFTDAAVRRPEVQRLVERIEVDESATPPVGPATFERGYAAIRVDCGGPEVWRRVDVVKGDRLAPLSRAELDAKFRDCAAFSGVGIDADALLGELWGLDGNRAFAGFAALAADRGDRHRSHA